MRTETMFHRDEFVGGRENLMLDVQGTVLTYGYDHEEVCIVVFMKDRSSQEFRGFGRLVR